MKFGVVVFPGTWSDCDFHYVISEVLHQPVKYVWHRERDLGDLDCVILPGGFSYGDYLRAGAVAGRSPVIDALRDFAGRGGYVLGSCNGFQILCEAGLLPGRAHAQRVPAVSLSVRPIWWSTTPTRRSPVVCVRARCSRCRSRTVRASTTSTPRRSPP